MGLYNPFTFEKVKLVRARVLSPEEGLSLKDLLKGLEGRLQGFGFLGAPLKVPFRVLFLGLGSGGFRARMGQGL